MRRLVRKCIELLFPSHAQCLACGFKRIEADGPPLCKTCLDEMETKRLQSNVCDKCGHSLLGNGCRFCKTEVCKRIAWMRAAYPYEGAPGKLVQRFKYDAVESAGTMMAAEMVHAFSTNRPPQIDVCTYVPMSGKAKRYRGEDHAQCLGEMFSRKTDIPLKTLLKANPTRKRQAQLNKEQRLKNKRGAYEVIENVKGLHILLIDDVVTTGASVRECAAVLLKAGAASVNVMCYAFA